MKFQEFMHELKKMVSDFEHHYSRQMEKDPKAYPEEFQSADDWWEQFEFFCSADDAGADDNGE